MDFLDYIGFSTKDNNIPNEPMKASIDFSETTTPVWLLGLMYQPFLVCSDEQQAGGSMLTSSIIMNPTPTTSSSSTLMMGNNNNQQQQYQKFQQQPNVNQTSFVGNEEQSPKTPPTKIGSFFSKSKKNGNKRNQPYSDSDLVKIYHNKLQLESFLLDFESRFWFSYRKDFEAISNSPLTIEPLPNQDQSFSYMSSTNSAILSSQGSTLSSVGNINNDDSSPFLVNFNNSPPSSSPSQYSGSNVGKSQSSSSLSKLYRYVINYTAPTSDTGWGCMMRSGQMLLAHGFLTHYLGRTFRLPATDRTKGMYEIILKWFQDADQCPYSIHRIARAGTFFGKKVGEWFGPSTISYVIKLLVEQHLKGEFVVHVADQGGIYIDEILSKCEYDFEEFSIDVNTVQKDISVYPQIECLGPRIKVTKKWRPLIILIPLRLGLESFNTDYIPSIRKVFEIPQSLGIMGGKPKSSLYFIGYQDNEVIYLDPHTTQKCSTKEETYHCKTPLKIPISKIDPSMALGFLCSTRQDFDEFCQLAQQHLAQHSHPLVCIRENKPQERDLDVISFDDLSDDGKYPEEDDDIVFV